MNFISKYNFKSFFLYSGVLGAGAGVFYLIHKNIKYRTAVNNVVTEYCEMALRSDSRIQNYCGSNFKIKHYEIVNSDRNSMTVRLIADGNRGKCKVLAKCEKSTHKYLKSHFEQQLKYSLLSKEEKSVSTFTPINYNDILIPDKELIERIKNVSRDKDIFSFDTDKYNSGYYSKLPILEKEQIKDDDIFWRISSLVLISKDSMIFNVRPISNKLKSYDIEDTFYKLSNYQNIIQNVIDFKDKYYSTTNKKLTNEEFRREVNQIKLTNIEKRSKNRTWIIFSEVILLIIGFISVRFFLNKVVTNHPGYFQALKIVKNSPSMGKIFGNYRTVLFASGRVFLSKDVVFKLHVLGNKNSGVVTFHSSDEPDFIKKADIVLKNEERITLKKSMMEENRMVINTQKTLNRKLFIKDIRNEVIDNFEELNEEKDKIENEKEKVDEKELENDNNDLQEKKEFNFEENEMMEENSKKESYFSKFKNFLTFGKKNAKV